MVQRAWALRSKEPVLFARYWALSSGRSHWLKRSITLEQLQCPRCGDILGKIWNIPNDIVGLGLGIAGLPFGGEHWGFGHNGLEITGNRLVNLSAPAITFGNVINYGTSVASSPNYQGQSYIYDNIVTGFHEEGHTYQGQIYGPVFIPAYLLGQIFKPAFPYVSPFTGAYVNPFEAGADNYASDKGP